jgi:two-component system osmolarity sensor histidine kinase EnvZ
LLQKLAKIKNRKDLPVLKRLRLAWRRFSRLSFLHLPKGLVGRSLLIIIVPMVVFQSVLAFVFMERHWQSVTQRLSSSVVRDIAAIVDIVEQYPQDADYKIITDIARDRMKLNISILPMEPLPAPAPKPFFSILDRVMGEQLRDRIEKPYWLDTVGDSDLLEVRINLGDKILRVYVYRNQAYASNSHIFLIWMVGTALVLIIIAVLFLLNQIKPIQQLANAADNFGKGQLSDYDFKPRGATEVRRAGNAFLIMRERIERQIEQRTAMLAGVSHDLRTVLTRFKLQLALVGDGQEVRDLQNDVDEMQNMLEGYLDFTRGDGGEDTTTVDIEIIMQRFYSEAEVKGKDFHYYCEGSGVIQARPAAFTRLVTNLISNAFRYANKVRVTSHQDEEWFILKIEDDGPGIPDDKVEEVFKPFVRLDEARNQDETGTGLGLTIARDIARIHGGDIEFSTSQMGGLKATVKLPV